MSETRILLYVKYPDPGHVKQRLIPLLTPQAAADLYRCFVADTLATLHRLPHPFTICYNPTHSQHDYEAWLGPHDYQPQDGPDLGARMHHSFTHAFTTGTDKAVLIGSDTPDLPPKLIQQAVDCLNTHDIVLGPALDGGYYLIACKQDRYLSDLFTNIPWSTPTVLQTTLDTIHRNHHTVFQIPTWQDIDTPKDLNRLIQRNQQTAFKSSQTFTYLTNLEQQLL